MNFIFSRPFSSASAILLAFSSVACGDEGGFIEPVAQDHAGFVALPDNEEVPTNAAGLPLLESRPEATVAFFLDFDGGEDNAGHWCAFNRVSGAFPESNSCNGNMPNSVNTFDAVEQQLIYDVWRRVTAWLAPFNINVTTKASVGKPWIWFVISNEVNRGASGPDSFDDDDRAAGRIPSEGATASNSSTIIHEMTHFMGGSHNVGYNSWGERIATGNSTSYMSPRDPLHIPLMGTDGEVAHGIERWLYWHTDQGPGIATDGLQDIIDRLSDVGDVYAEDDDQDNSASTPRSLSEKDHGLYGAGVIETLEDVDWFRIEPPQTRNYSIIVSRDFPSPIDLEARLYANDGSTLLAFEDGSPLTKPYRTVNDQFISAVELVAGTTYKLRVRSHRNYGDIGRYNVRIDPLPNGTNDGVLSPKKWQAHDVGLCKRPGYAKYWNGTFTVAAHGDDMTDVKEDSFHYVFQPLQGDGSITVRVDEISTTDGAMAGVMFRESLAPDAKYAAIFATPNGRHSMRRIATGATSTKSSQTTGTTFSPTWLRLTRTGATIRAEHRLESEASWTTFSDTTVSMSARLVVGIASHRNLDVPGGSPAKISGVTTTGDVNPGLNVDTMLAVPTGLSVSNTGPGTIRVAWNALSGVSYVLERSPDGINFEPLVVSSAFWDGPAEESLRYRFRVRSRNAGGSVSNPSAAVDFTSPLVAVQDLAVSNVTEWDLSTYVVGRRDTALALEWTDVSYEDGYRVWRKADPNPGAAWTSVAALAPNVTIFRDTGLTPNTRYFYKVETLPSPGPVASIERYTALPTISSGQFDPDAPVDSLGFNWSKQTGASRYEIDRSEGGEWVQRGVVAGNATIANFRDYNLATLERYVYSVRGANDFTYSNDRLTFLAATAPSGSQVLPPGWDYKDVGNVVGRGASGETNGLFTLLVGGKEVDDQSDSFHFASSVQPQSGLLIKATWMRSDKTRDQERHVFGGVMIREKASDAGAKFVALYMDGKGNLHRAYRSSTGATATVSLAADLDMGEDAYNNEVRLRIERVDGNSWAAAYTDLAGNWIAVPGYPDFSMANPDVRIGLFGASGNTNDRMAVQLFKRVETNFSGGEY